MRSFNSIIVAALLVACGNKEQSVEVGETCHRDELPVRGFASIDERMLEPELILPDYGNARDVAWVRAPDGSVDGIVLARWGSSPVWPTDYLRRDGHGVWNVVASAPWLQATIAESGKFGFDGSEMVIFGEPDLNRLVLGHATELAAPDRFHSFPLPGMPGQVHVADVDGDGVDDTVVVVFVQEDRQNVSLLVTVAGVGDGTLIERARLPLGTGYWGVTLGDVNGDGLIDAVASNSKPTVDILLGVGGGNFERASTITISTPSEPGGPPLNASGKILHDLNGDGRLDLVIAGGSTTAGLLYFEGDGSGGFGPPLEVAVPSNGSLRVRENGSSLQLITQGFDSRRIIVVETPLSATPRVAEFHPASSALDGEVGDFDGDGITDILIGNLDVSTNGLRLLRGSGRSLEGFRTFPQPGAAARGVVLQETQNGVTLAIAATEMNSILIGTLDGNGFDIKEEIRDVPEPHAIAAIDLNVDGHLDFVVASLGRDVSAYLRLEDGSFQRSQLLEGVAWDFAVGDFDGDCKDDVAMSLPAERELAVVYSRPTKEWPVSRIKIDGEPGSLLAHDVDGDGDDDLIAALFKSGIVVRIENQGKDGLSGIETLATIPTPLGLAACDVDGDGAPEIVVGSFNGRSVFIVAPDGSMSEFSVGDRVASVGTVAAPSGCGAIAFSMDGAFHSVGWSEDAADLTLKSWPYVARYNLGPSTQVLTTGRSVITFFPQTSRIGFLPASPGTSASE